MKILKENNNNGIINYQLVDVDNNYIPTDKEKELTAVFLKEKIREELKKGVYVGDFNFTENSLVKFITATDFVEKKNSPTIDWQDVYGSKITLTVQEARTIQEQAFVLFNNIYFG